MSISRKEWLANKQETEWNEKIRYSAQKMKMNFAVISASVLLANLVEPVKHIMAAEKATESQNTVKLYSANPFLNSLIPSASSIAQKNDLYASVMLAQAILESGWGKSTLASEPNHNLFGIKGNYQGNSVNMNTKEDSGNQNYYEIQADFRKYPSYHESLEDYASVLRNGTGWDPLFYNGTWKSNASTYQDATAYLTGRYATDSAYNSKLNQIIEKNGLTQYDTPSSHVLPVIEEEIVDQSISATTNTSYTVKSGDTLYAIAGKYGISLTDLMKWNQLSSSLLHIGDVLLVSNKVNKVPVVTETQVDKDVNKPEQSKPVSTAVYQVKSGDSLWKISQLNNVTVAQLKTWNNLKTNIIQPGQKLRLTNQVETTVVPEKKPTESKPVQEQPEKITALTVTVVSGDTLYKIANKASVSVSQLKEWNKLQSDLIHPGQTLVVQAKGNPTVVTPNKEESVPVKEQSTSSQNSTTTTVYTVKSGDSLYRIANQVGVSVGQLKEWNQLQSDLIHPGQNLSVEAKGNNVVDAPNKEESTPVKEQSVEKVEQTTPSNQSSTSSVHTVKSGDTLYRIANQAGVSVSQLKEWNQLSSDTILVGQTLQLGNKKVVEQVEKPAIQITEKVSQTYSVKSGDTLYAISKQYGVSITQLIEWNNVTSNMIYVGQQLQVK